MSMFKKKPAPAVHPNPQHAHADDVLTRVDKGLDEVLKKLRQQLNDKQRKFSLVGGK